MRSVIEMPKKLKTFQKDERGAIAIIFGLALVPVIFFSGIAIDYGRAMHAKTMLQGAADAAVVAASNSNGTDEDKLQIAANIFAANAGSTATTTPTITTSNNVSTITTTTRWGQATTTIAVTPSSITVKPTIEVPTIFMKIAFVNTITADAKSKATGSAQKKLEVAMMIDLTGSMGQNDRATSAPKPKIDGLKTAAADFLNILFPNGATSSTTTRVAIVPFADYVNAGTFASAVTGLPNTGTVANGGTYSNLTNLANTKQGTFTGKYSGTFASLNTAGSTPTGTQVGGQCGAKSTYQPSGSTAPVGTNTATFQSTFTTNCIANPATAATPGTPAVPAGASTTVDKKKDSTNTNFIGVYLDKEDSSQPDSTSVILTGTRQPVKHNGTAFINDGSTSNNKFFVPIPVTTTGLTIKQHSSSSRDYGVAFTCAGCSTSTPPAGIKYGNFRKVKKVDSDKTNSLDSDNDSGFYLPIYTSLTLPGTAGSPAIPGTAATNQQCSSTVDQTATSSLISCVTERQGGEAYSDLAPASGHYVGAYNAGNTARQNYSSDGKCYVAGRELPKVIPLTNDKTKLTSFFDTCSVGGATPGHIGTAWAWYMISPEWSTIFPAASAPAAYSDTKTIKAVVLMTDGEYNVHYATETAKAQALELCTAMRNKGVKVYVIGFGFPADETQDSTSEANARDTLKSCAGSIAGTYFFPYDGAQLKRDFTVIGNGLNDLTLSDIKISGAP